MMKVRKADDRGHANHGWLDSHHTFSFGDYYDPEQMGFRSLRVINDDRVAPGGGFPTHSHRDMEIVSYVLEGALEHKDSIGTGSVIVPCDVQRMSAGSGVAHSEFNGSPNAPVHFLQIWILPDQRGLPPSYEQKAFSAAEKRGRLRVIASPDRRDGSVAVHADVIIHAGLFTTGETHQATLAPGRHAYVHVARGSIELNGVVISEGDGAALSEESSLRLSGTRDEAEVLLFDLA